KAPPRPSSLSLHDALPSLRTKLIDEGEIITRPEEGDGEASDKLTQHQERIEPIMNALLDNVPPIKTERSKVEQAQFILAHMLDRSEEHTSELQSRENLVCR